jgi:LysR family transcriptional regulator, low CO2-responsive transcriptional regulator
MAVTLTQLRSFLAVVRTGSVTDAAEDLTVTQPTVSAALSALSRELGVELTERVGRGVRPSPAGRAFAAYAEDVVGLLDQGARAAREAAGSAARELRIAAVTTAGEHIVPPVMEAFRAEQPDVALSVYVGNRERVLARLRAHESDLAIGGRPPAEGGVVATRFLENPIVVLTRPGDPLARRRAVPAAALEERPWLLREEGSGTRLMTEEFLAAHGLAPRLLTLGSNGAIKQGVRAGLGIALQSRLAAEPELGLGLLGTVSVREPLPLRHWHVLRAERGPLRPAADAFSAFLAGPRARRAIEAAHRPPG